MTYTAKTYMDQHHPDAFVDHVVKTQQYGMTKPCPVCKMFGGWNLQLNAYSLHGKEDTPENRHKFVHFRCICSHCNGWGFTSLSEECDGHNWWPERNTGRCLNLYRCTKCNKTQEVDSSD